MSAVDKRIVGLESEKAVTFWMNEELFQTCGVSDYDMLIIYRCLPEEIVSTNGGFLSNGSRLYKDYGAKLEYATPECSSFADAIYCEYAGEEIVLKALRHLVEAKQYAKFAIHKRVIDDDNNTWGHHENYLMERAAYDSPLRAAALAGHLATRSVLFGAGRWDPTLDNLTRVLPPQKLHGIRLDIGLDTTKDKPLLNTRDEPHTDRSRWARVHITSGDAHISPWAGWMNLGSTALVLRLIENGFFREAQVVPLDSLMSARSVAENPDRPIELRTGRFRLPIDIQQSFVDMCHRMAARIDLPEEEITVINEWQKACDDYKKDPSLLASRVEWLARRYLLSGYAEKHSHLDLDQLLTNLKQVDQLWDNLKPEAGIGVKRRKLMGFPGYDPSKINNFITNPPEGTRAHQRAKIIKDMPQYKRDRAAVDWEYIEWSSRKYPRVRVRLYDARGHNSVKAVPLQPAS